MEARGERSTVRTPKIGKDYLVNDWSPSHDDFLSVNNHIEWLFAQLKRKDDTQDNHTTDSLKRLLQKTNREQRTPLLTHDDMLWIRKEVRERKKVREKERECEEREAERKREERKRKQDGREKTKKRTEERERLLEKTALVLDEDKVRRMIGSELETQIHLWRKRVSERKIPLNGKVQEKKERVIALIREKKTKIEEAEEREDKTMEEEDEMIVDEKEDQNEEKEEETVTEEEEEEREAESLQTTEKMAGNFSIERFLLMLVTKKSGQKRKRCEDEATNPF